MRQEDTPGSLISTPVAFPTWSRRAQFPLHRKVLTRTHIYVYFCQNLHRPCRLALCALQAKVAQQ